MTPTERPVTCVICFESFDRSDLEPVSDEPGKVWDVCRFDAQREKIHGAKY